MIKIIYLIKISYKHLIYSIYLIIYLSKMNASRQKLQSSFQSNNKNRSKSKSKQNQNDTSFSSSMIKSKQNTTSSEVFLKLYTQIKDLLYEMIEKSIEIAEFKKVHIKNQIDFQEREVEKEINFSNMELTFSIDYDFGINKGQNKRIFTFISSNFKKIILIDLKGRVDIYDIESLRKNISTKESFNIYNSYENEMKIVDVKYSTSKDELYILQENLTLLKFSIYDYISSDVSIAIYNKVYKSKKCIFHIKNYIDNMNLEYILSSPLLFSNIIQYDQSSDEIYLNFSFEKCKILVLNTNTFQVKTRILINRLGFLNISNKTLVNSNLYLLSFIFNADLYLDAYLKIETNLNDYIYKPENKSKRDNFICIIKKIFSDSLDLTQFDMFIYYIFSLDDIDFQYIVMNIKEILSFFYEFSILFEENKKQSLVAGETRKGKICSRIRINPIYEVIFYMLKRNIRLFDLISQYDNSKSGKIHKDLLITILESACIGYSHRQCEEIIESLPISIDNHIFYNEIFDSKVMFLIETFFNKVNSLSHQGLSSFYYGFFKNKIDSTHSPLTSNPLNIKISNKIHAPERISLSEEEFLYKIKENNNNNKTRKESQLLNYFQLNFNVLSIIHDPGLGIFILEDNKHNVYICKEENSTLNPIAILYSDLNMNRKSRILKYVFERQLLILFSEKKRDKQQTASETENLYKNLYLSGGFIDKDSNIDEIVFVDIMKDCINMFQYKTIWEIREFKKIPSPFLETNELLVNCNYLSSTNLLYFTSNKRILVMNPRLKQVELTLKYNEFMEKNEFIKNLSSLYDSNYNIYDNICNSLCELSFEQTVSSKHMKEVLIYDINTEQTPIESYEISSFPINSHLETGFFPSDSLILTLKDKINNKINVVLLSLTNIVVLVKAIKFDSFLQNDKRKNEIFQKCLLEKENFLKKREKSKSRKQWRMLNLENLVKFIFDVENKGFSIVNSTITEFDYKELKEEADEFGLLIKNQNFPKQENMISIDINEKAMNSSNTQSYSYLILSQEAYNLLNDFFFMTLTNINIFFNSPHCQNEETEDEIKKEVFILIVKDYLSIYTYNICSSHGYYVYIHEKYGSFDGYIQKLSLSLPERIHKKQIDLYFISSQSSIKRLYDSNRNRFLVNYSENQTKNIKTHYNLIKNNGFFSKINAFFTKNNINKEDFFSRLKEGLNILSYPEFKKGCLNLITDLEEKEIEEVFNKIDINKTGVISDDEFYLFFENQTETNKNIQSYQENNSQVNENENQDNYIENKSKPRNGYLFFLVKYIKDKIRLRETSSENLFITIDTDKKGFITLNDLLLNLSKALKIDLSINQIRLFFNLLDRNNDGIVVFDDLKSFFKIDYSLLIFSNKNRYETGLSVSNLIIENVFKKGKEIKDLFSKNIKNSGELFSFLNTFSYLTNNTTNINNKYIKYKLSQTDIDCLLLTENYKNNSFSLKVFLVFLEKIGVNTGILFDFTEINEVFDEYILNFIENLYKKLGSYQLESSNHDSISSSSFLKTGFYMSYSTLYSYFNSKLRNNDKFLSYNNLKSLIISIVDKNYSQNQYLNRIIYRILLSFNDNLQDISTSQVTISQLSGLIIYYTNILNSKGNISLNNTPHLINNLTSEIVTLNTVHSLINDFHVLSNDYKEMLTKGKFLGLITLSKALTCVEFENKINGLSKFIESQMNKYLNIAIKTIWKELNIVNQPEFFNKYKEMIDFISIEIPTVPTIIQNESDCLYRYYLYSFSLPELQFSSAKPNQIGEVFIYNHPTLKTYSNILKLYKNECSKLVSNDNINLLQHINQSFKITYSLTNQSNKDKSFFSGFAHFSYKAIRNNSTDEDIFFLSEAINNDKYVNMNDLIKRNGGLLFISQLYESEICLNIIKYWASRLLDIFVTLHLKGVCFKFITLNDFYISKDGFDIRLKPVFHYSLFNKDNFHIFSGPDIEFINIFYNKENILSDPYTPPEFILNQKKTLKTDSWLFGCLLYTILFGEEPPGVYDEIKKFVDESTNLKFEKVKFPYDILNEAFFYIPFKERLIRRLNPSQNCSYKEIIVNSIKKKSFNEMLMEKDRKIGKIFDLISNLLSIRPDDRLLLVDIYQSINEIFYLDGYEILLTKKVLPNIINYYSPDDIHDNIYIPLRNICSKVIHNSNNVTEYENFILTILTKLDFYLFSGYDFDLNDDLKVESNEYNANSDGSKDNIYESHQKDKRLTGKEGKVFVDNKFLHKNSEIIKILIENKVIDMLIFLILRDFAIRREVYQSKRLSKYSNSFSSTASFDVIDFEVNCNLLLNPLLNIIHKSILSMKEYSHELNEYVEDVLTWIVKLYIGEDYSMSSGRILSKHRSIRNGSMIVKDNLVKYMEVRTFMRREESISRADFKEDEADKTWSFENLNKPYSFRESYWSVELNYFTGKLFKMSFSESGTGFFKLKVIKEYLKQRNNQINEEEEDELYYLSQSYINELFSLSDCLLHLSNSNDNFHTKKSAIIYMNTVLKHKDINRLYAFIDIKPHLYLPRFLNSPNQILKNECIHILKDISFRLIDKQELSWVFGNEYETFISNIINNNWDLTSPLLTELNLISSSNRASELNYSMLQYITSHSCTVIENINQKIRNGQTCLKDVLLIELSSIFKSCLYLKPIISILNRSSETLHMKISCLEIVMNILLSNNNRLISELNSTLSNFYEALGRLISTFIVQNTSIVIKDEEKKDVRQVYFNSLLKNIVNLIIKIENPLVKSQFFKSKYIKKYLTENNIIYKERMDFDQIEDLFEKINPIDKNVNVDSVVKGINSLKCWINTNYDKIYDSINSNHQNNGIYNRISHIYNGIIKLFNIKWSEGLVNISDNKLLFWIVKFLHWTTSKNLYSLIFNNKDPCSIILSMTLKIKEVYKNIQSDEYYLNLSEAIDKIDKAERLNINKSMTNMRISNEKTKFKVISYGNSKEEMMNKDSSMKMKKTVSSKGIINSNTLISTSFTNKDKSYLLRIYHYLAINLQIVLLRTFETASSSSSFILQLEKIKFGSLVSDLFYVQYSVLNKFIEYKITDIFIFNTYIQENNLRFEMFYSLFNCKSQVLIYQFLESNIIDYVVSKHIHDYRKFSCSFKRIPMEFLLYKDSYPLRNEVLSFLAISMSNPISDYNRILYDEFIKSIIKNKSIPNEMKIIKNSQKGERVMSALILIDIIVKFENKDLLVELNKEGYLDIVCYAFNKDMVLKRKFRRLNKMIEV